jgi:thiamine pyrophosphokinase
MEKVIFIISGGQLGDPAFFNALAAEKSPAAVICADGGARRLENTALSPTLIVGDMDSLDPGTLAQFESRGVRIIRRPREKDETDTELALHEAFAMAPAEIWIWGALGNRIDHTLANISLLLQGVRRKIGVRLIDSWCELFMLRGKGRAVVDGEEGQTVSLFPWGGKVSGLTLTGFEYPLVKARMEAEKPFGISNRLRERRGVIDVDRGVLLVVRYFRPGTFPGEER